MTDREADAIRIAVNVMRSNVLARSALLDDVSKAGFTNAEARAAVDAIMRRIGD